LNVTILIAIATSLNYSGRSYAETVRFVDRKACLHNLIGQPRKHPHRDRLHNIISITSRFIANFVFKFIPFRCCINKGWSSKRLIDNVQSANTIRCKNVVPYESNYVKSGAKIPRCCCHGTRGSSGTNFTYTVKWIPRKRVVWCMNWGSILFTSRVIANILLKFTNFCYHDNKVNLQNTQFRAKVLDLSQIWGDL